MVAPRETAELAKRLISNTCAKQGIAPETLTIHAARGTSMTSKPVALLMADLGVTKTHGRPHVSDDNPYSKSQFKTLKYRPEFPDRFGFIEHSLPLASLSLLGITMSIIPAASPCWHRRCCIRHGWASHSTETTGSRHGMPSQPRTLPTPSANASAPADCGLDQPANSITITGGRRDQTLNSDATCLKLVDTIRSGMDRVRQAMLPFSFLHHAGLFFLIYHVTVLCEVP